MMEVTTPLLKQLDEDLEGVFKLFIHTPFCGTCHIARKMLSTLEEVWQQEIFIDVNASLHPEFMERFKVESVPCLLIIQGNEVKERIYAFQSVPYLYGILEKYDTTQNS